MLPDCTLAVFRRLKQRGLIASHGGRPYATTRLGLLAVRAQLDNTVPMPKVEAMRMVWTPYQNALGEVLAGRRDAGQQLLAVEREVEGYLKR